MSYFSYSFLNKLGATELENADTKSWATKNKKGDMQLLFWDYTNTHPGDSVLNQKFYVQDLPSKPKGSVKIEVAGLQKGKYTLEIYKVGYKVNDVYTDYLGMNKPHGFSPQQVNTLKQKNNGEPIATEKITIDSKGKYSKDININENDVLFLNFVKQ